MLDADHKRNVSFKPIILGFVLSVALTYASYAIAVHSSLKGWACTLAIMGLGTIQALVQLICFLHLGIELKPRWSLIMFLFMVLVVVIVVGGSLWIMYNLNYYMMEH